MLKMDVKFEIGVTVIDLAYYEYYEYNTHNIKDKFISLDTKQVEEIIFRSSQKDTIYINDDMKIIFADYHINDSKKVILLASKKEDTKYIILNPKHFLEELEEDYMEFYMQTKLSNLLKLDTEAALEFQTK